jgi:hypothetical protein
MLKNHFAAILFSQGGAMKIHNQMWAKIGMLFDITALRNLWNNDSINILMILESSQYELHMQWLYKNCEYTFAVGDNY